MARTSIRSPENDPSCWWKVDVARGRPRSELGHALRRDGRLDEAEAVYRQSIHGWQRTGNRGAVANQVESFALVALARGDGVRATPVRRVRGPPRARWSSDDVAGTRRIRRLHRPTARGARQSGAQLRLGRGTPDQGRCRGSVRAPGNPADPASGDTLIIGDSLANSRSCYCAHEVRTSQAECRGFESRLPLHLPSSERAATC
jgi:hypothetical protein